MKLDRVVEVIADDVEVIVAGLASALLHLADWSGEYPASASGAAPSSGAPVEPGAGDAEVAVLTRVESFALHGDPAMRSRLALLGQLRVASMFARSMFARVDGCVLPVLPVSDAEDLAVLRWAVRRLRSDPAGPGDGQVGRLARSVELARRMVDQYQPPKVTGVAAGCRLHRAVGDHASISRQYRSVGLCRHCGDFRVANRCDPTPQILRAWSKGIKPTRAQLDDALAAGKKKRARARRNA